jgi:hypothetical protein
MIGSKISWILGLTVSLLIGHIISYLVVKHLRVKINRWVDVKGNKYTRFTSLLGILERFLYTICIVYDVKFLVAYGSPLKWLVDGHRKIVYGANTPKQMMLNQEPGEQ